jgi:hypothetical protein
MSSTEAEIRAEIAKAMRKTGMPEDDIALARSGTGRAISWRLQKFGAPIELLALVGSWGDTLTDEELLHDLRRFNQTGSIFDEDIQ